jgi:hypothetical protein
MPGVLAGAVFAFVTSFDEVVVALFLSGTSADDAAGADVERHPLRDQSDGSPQCR